MRLSDEPVVAETLVAARASIGYIVVQGVAEDILSGRCDGNMVASWPMTTPSSHSQSIWSRPRDNRIAQAVGHHGQW
jgi:hypothetical protein